MEHTQFLDGGWCWMTHPSHNDGNPIPAKMVFEEGERWYLPCDPNGVTEFEWDRMDDKWQIVFGPMASPEQEIAALKAQRDELLEALIDVIGWVPTQGWHTDAPDKAVNRARALIAKHKVPA